MHVLKLLPFILTICFLCSCDIDDERLTDKSGDSDAVDRGNIVLNEIDSSGEPADFIELYNNSDSAVTLESSRWFLTDDKNEFTLPSITIEAGAFHSFVKEAEDSFDFGLSSDGETITLSYLKADNTLETIDYYKYGSGAHSIGRIPDGTGSWVACDPSSGSANTAK